MVTSPPVRVMIADDQVDVRAAFRMFIDAQPDLTVVAEAADGVSAVEQATLLRPDVVLTDIRMPRMDGLAVTRSLAGPDAERPLRVVVVTTFDLDDYVYTALRNGACGFLLKRSGPTLLVEAVRAAMAGDVLVSPAITVRLLRHLRPRLDATAASAPVARLTERELEIVRVLALGRSNAEIASALFLAPGTVKNHVASIQRKLDVRNRVGVAAWAWENGVMQG